MEGNHMGAYDGSMPLLEPVHAKGHEGEHKFSQWRVAIDAFQTMVGFLNLTPDGMRFTEATRESMRRDVERLCQCGGQMDSGQRGKGVSFDELPHLMSRISVAATVMALSGKLDEVKVDE